MSKKKKGPKDPNYPQRLPGGVCRYVACPCCGSTLWQSELVEHADKHRPIVARDYKFSGPKAHPGERGGGGSIKKVAEYGPLDLKSVELSYIVPIWKAALVRGAKALSCFPREFVERLVVEHIVPDWVKVKLQKMQEELRYWRRHQEQAGTFSRPGPVHKVESKHVRRLEALTRPLEIDFVNPVKRVMSDKVKRLPDAAVNEDWCSK